MESSRTSTISRVAISILIILLVAAVASAVFFYKKSTKSDTATAGGASELAQILDAVGKLVVLPAGEEPTLATISEPEKLADQPFFRNAQKGDKVLIYTGARKAILYSPSLNKVVEIAPINDSPDTAPPIQ